MPTWFTKAFSTKTGPICGKIIITKRNYSKYIFSNGHSHAGLRLQFKDEPFPFTSYMYIHFAAR